MNQINLLIYPKVNHKSKDPFASNKTIEVFSGDMSLFQKQYKNELNLSQASNNIILGNNLNEFEDQIEDFIHVIDLNSKNSENVQKILKPDLRFFQNKNLENFQEFEVSPMCNSFY